MWNRHSSKEGEIKMMDTKKVVGKILGDRYSKHMSYTSSEIKLVQDVDSYAQDHSPILEKQFARIFSFADKDAQDYGWPGIAQKNPHVFEQAYMLARKNKR
jgi:hypothetical protein